MRLIILLILIFHLGALKASTPAACPGDGQPPEIAQIKVKGSRDPQKVTTFITFYEEDFLPKAMGFATTALALVSPLFTGLTYWQLSSLESTLSRDIKALVPYFAFIRQPVLRDANGRYMECSRDVYSSLLCPGSTLTQIRGVFSNPKDYFNKFEGYSDQPCYDQKYRSTNDYQWPKNRVNNSNFIEVCFRAPINLEAIQLGDVMSSLPGLSGLLFSSYPRTLLPEERTHYPLQEGVGDCQDCRSNLIRHKESKYSDPNCPCKVLSAGQEATISGMKFKALANGNSLCVYAVRWMQSRSFNVEIGCQRIQRAFQSAPMCKEAYDSISGTVDNTKCRCTQGGLVAACRGINAKTVNRHPMTSAVAGCISEASKRILQGSSSNSTDNCGDLQVSFIDKVKSRLKNMVMALMVLAITMMGFRLMTGMLESYAEIMILAVKLAAVSYFVFGNGLNIYYQELIKLSTGLGSVVMGASESNGICDFKPSDYRVKNNVELMFWDKLDCRMAFYLGQSVKNSPYGVAYALVVVATGIFGAFIFSYQIMLFLAMMFTFIMLVLIMMWAVYLFLVSMIVLNALVLVGPLFIPLCLFKNTKDFFDGWIKELVHYSVYPVLIFAFLSLYMATADHFFFGGLPVHKEVMRFKALNENYVYESVNKYQFYIKNSDCQEPRYANSLACVFFNLFGSYNTEVTSILGLRISKGKFNENATQNLWETLLLFVFFNFLFYHFVKSVGKMAAHLTGNPNFGNISQDVTSPTAVMHRINTNTLSAGMWFAGKTGLGKTTAKVMRAPFGAGAAAGAPQGEAGAAAKKADEKAKQKRTRPSFSNPFARRGSYDVTQSTPDMNSQNTDEVQVSRTIPANLSAGADLNSVEGINKLVREIEESRFPAEAGTEEVTKVSSDKTSRSVGDSSKTPKKKLFGARGEYDVEGARQRDIQRPSTEGTYRKLSEDEIENND